MESVLFDVLDAIGKGFSAVEIVWDTAGRDWMPGRLIWRDPRWFMFDWVGGEKCWYARSRKSSRTRPQAATAGPSLRGAMCLPASAPAVGNSAAHRAARTIQVHRAYGEGEVRATVRGGMARAAGWSYLFKNYVLKDWITFTEIFGQPLRVGKYGPGATEATSRHC